jgi:hypothetical protein
MRLVELAVVLAGSLVLAPVATWAQTPAKVPRVSAVSFGHADAPVSRQGKAAFEAGLREAGWIPESTIAVKYYWANADSDQLARHVAEIVRSAPDVIVARTGLAQRDNVVPGAALVLLHHRKLNAIDQHQLVEREAQSEGSVPRMRRPSTAGLELGHRAGRNGQQAPADRYLGAGHAGVRPAWPSARGQLLVPSPATAGSQAAPKTQRDDPSGLSVTTRTTDPVDGV